MPEFQPKVSIVIPVYNGSRYLAQAIDSALAQSYSNCEILVVNDGSTDEGKSAAVARAYDGKVKYFEKPNGGVASALNFGISKATGRYLSWLSHDDLYPAYKVAVQIEALGEIPEEERDRTVVYGDWREVDSNGDYLGRGNIVGKHPDWKLNLPLYPIVNGLLHGCSLLIPLELLRSHNGFREELRTTQDVDCWSRILPSNRVLFVPRIMVHSRIHPEQTSRTDLSHARESGEVWDRILKMISIEDMEKLEGSAEGFRQKFLEFQRRAGLVEGSASVQQASPKWRTMLIRALKNLGFARVRTWYLRLVDN